MKPPVRCPPPMNSYANCIHRLQGIEERFKKVANRNIARNSDPRVPIHYAIAATKAMGQGFEMPFYWDKVEEALQ